jgi:phi13 family phage major tail protein
MAENTKPMSTIGMKHVVLAEVIKDDETGTEYGTVEQMIGAVDATITPQNTEAEVQYADDGEYDAVYPDPESEFRMKMVDIPLPWREKLYGHRFDSNGVLIQNAKDTQKYFAVGFMSEKADHTMRYMWFYKVRAAPMTENYSTKEGETITRQTGEVEWTAIKRTHDGQYQAVADEGENGFTSEMAATFLQSVYAPTFTPPSP